MKRKSAITSTKCCYIYIIIYTYFKQSKMPKSLKLYIDSIFSKKIFFEKQWSPHFTTYCQDEVFYYW